MPRKKRCQLTGKKRRQQNRERQRVRRAADLEEAEEKRKEHNRQAQERHRRLRETDEEAEARRKRDAEAHRLKRYQEVLRFTPQQFSQDLKRKSEQRKSRWMRLTPEQKEARRLREQEKRRKRREDRKEDEEEIELKRKKYRMFSIFSKFCAETKEEIQERLRRDREERIEIRYKEIQLLKQQQLQAKEQQKANVEQANANNHDRDEPVKGEVFLSSPNDERNEPSTSGPHSSPTTTNWEMDERIKSEGEEEEGDFEYAFGPSSGWEEEDQSLNFLDYDANEEDESYMKMREGETLGQWTARVRNHERDGATDLQPLNKGCDELESVEEEGGVPGSRPSRKAALNAISNLKRMRLEEKESGVRRGNSDPPSSRPRSPLPSLRLETKEERIKRLGDELERRKDYMTQVIAKKMGEEAVKKFHDLISQPLQRKATFVHQEQSSGSGVIGKKRRRLRLKDMSQEEREEFLRKKKEQLEALPEEVIKQKKAMAAANARTKNLMDKEEYRIYHILSSLDPLKIFEDEKGIESLKWWAAYKSTKLPYEVWKWRMELYPILTATPPDNETEEEKFTRYEEIMNKINTCVTLYGEKVKEYVTYQKNKMTNYVSAYNKKKLEACTPEQALEHREKLNAYFREKYREKKLKEGISIKVLGSRRARKATCNDQKAVETEPSGSGCGLGSRECVDAEESQVPKPHITPENESNPMLMEASFPQQTNPERKRSKGVGKHKEKSSFVLVSPPEEGEGSIELDEMMRDSGDEDYHDDHGNDDGMSNEEWTPIATFEIDQMIQDAALEHPQIIGESDSLTNDFALNGQEKRSSVATNANFPSSVAADPARNIEASSFPSTCGSPQSYGVGQGNKHHSSLIQQGQIPQDFSPQINSNPQKPSIPVPENVLNPGIAEQQPTSTRLASQEFLNACSSQSEKASESPADSEEKGASEGAGAEAKEYEKTQEAMCPHCSKFFKSGLDCDAHVLKVHGSPSPFACCVCCKGFTSTKELIHHIWMSHLESGCGPTPSCPHCNKTFPRQKSLEVHIQKRHQDKLDKNITRASPFYCFLCCSELGGEIQLKSHMETVHKPTRASLYFCKFCGILIKFSDHLKQHISLFHENECGDLAEYENTEEEEESSRIFTCDICDSRFLNEEYLKSHQILVSHLRVEEEEDISLKYKCTSCDKKFVSAQLRDEHFLRDCSLNKVTCVKCGEMFTTQARLYEHVILNHSHKTEKSSKSADSTDPSDKKHTLFFPAGHKGYKCELCTRSYENVSTLFSHFSRQHWDFVQKIILKKGSPVEKESEAQNQNIQNTDEDKDIISCGPSSTPLPPPVIPMSLRPYESLSSRYVHTCNLCENAFSGKTFHEIHTNYTKLMKKTCPLCSKGFIRSASLVKHLRETHKFDECTLGVVEESLEGVEKEGSTSPEIKRETLDCTVCFASLSAQHFHKEHLAVGLKCDPYVKTCTICGSKLIGSFSVLRHMRQFHSTNSSSSLGTPPCEENPTLPKRIVVFPCTICKTNYKNFDFLKIHFERKHSDADLSLKEKWEGRGLCEVCNKTFFHVDNLVKHKMEIHKEDKNSLECEPCAKVFESEERLQTHRESLHFPQHFNTFCDICGKQMRAEYIRRHVKFYHPEEAGKIVKSESKKVPVPKILEIIWKIRDGREKPKEIEKCTKKAENENVDEQIGEKETCTLTMDRIIEPCKDTKKNTVELVEIAISSDEEEQSPLKSLKKRTREESSKNKKRKVVKKKKMIRRNCKKNKKTATDTDSNSEEELALEKETSLSEDENVQEKKLTTVQEHLKNYPNLMKSFVLLEKCDDLVKKQMKKVTQPSSSSSATKNLERKKGTPTRPSRSNHVVKTYSRKHPLSLRKAPPPRPPPFTRSGNSRKSDVNPTSYIWTDGGASDELSKPKVNIWSERRKNRVAGSSKTNTNIPASTLKGKGDFEGRGFLSWRNQERMMTGDSSYSLESDGVEVSTPITIQQLMEPVEDEHFPLHDDEEQEIELDFALFPNNQNEEENEILQPLEDPLANTP